MTEERTPNPDPGANPDSRDKEYQAEAVAVWEAIAVGGHEVGVYPGPIRICHAIGCSPLPEDLRARIAALGVPFACTLLRSLILRTPRRVDENARCLLRFLLDVEANTAKFHGGLGFAWSNTVYYLETSIGMPRRKAEIEALRAVDPARLAHSVIEAARGPEPSGPLN